MFLSNCQLQREPKRRRCRRTPNRYDGWTPSRKPRHDTNHPLVYNGVGIAPVPSNNIRDPFRLRVRRTKHDHWDCRLDACENSELPVWKPAVANWDGGDAPPHVSF